MRNAFVTSLLFALFTSVSVAATAAPAGSASLSAPMTASAVQEQTLIKVNINTADAVTLEKELSGIGKGKAGAIVAYRETNGEFTSVDELIEVKGIGKSLLEKNRDKLAVTDQR